jgi:hypothetical protein
MGARNRAKMERVHGMWSRMKEGWEKGKKVWDGDEEDEDPNVDVVRSTLIALLLVFFAFVFIVVGLAVVIRMVGNRW